MKNIFKNIVTIITLVAAVVGVLSFIYQVKSNNPKLEILEISNDNLTNLPRVRNLKSSFHYKDSLITNLWKLNTSIKNISSKTIIGKGNNKNIIDNSLTFNLNNGFKLIDFNINNSDFPNTINIKNNEVQFMFNQWRKDEKIDITIYAEQILSKDKELKLLMNEREIIDGLITYRKVNQPLEKDSKLIDFLPTPLKSILFWIGMIFYGFIILLLPIGFAVETNKYLSYQKWKRIWLSEFNIEISNLLSMGEITTKFKPEDTPVSTWEKLSIPKPEIPSNSLSSLIFALILVSVLFVIPILWMIEI